MLGVFGLMAIILPFLLNVPEPSLTTKISGTLKNYHYYQWGRGKSDYLVILKLNEFENEFEESYLNRQLCEKILNPTKSSIAFYIDNKNLPYLNSTKRLSTIGLEIDNKTYRTKEDALKNEKLSKNYLLPLVGIMLIFLSYFFNRKTKKETNG